MEDEAKVKSQELIAVKVIKEKQETQIQELQDYKKVAEKDLKKKIMSIQNAENAKAKMHDDYELERYANQEGLKDINEIKVRMEVQKQDIEHLNSVVAAVKLEKEEVELARIEI